MVIFGLFVIVALGIIGIFALIVIPEKLIKESGERDFYFDSVLEFSYFLKDKVPHYNSARRINKAIALAKEDNGFDNALSQKERLAIIFEKYYSFFKDASLDSKKIIEEFFQKSATKIN